MAVQFDIRINVEQADSPEVQKGLNVISRIIYARIGSLQEELETIIEMTNYKAIVRLNIEGDISERDD
jgi:hypothetical protein